MPMLDPDVDLPVRSRTLRSNLRRDDAMTQNITSDPDTFFAVHPRFDRHSPALEGPDVVAIVLAAGMMLGPLLAYAVGLGP
jgi:hypothetical protein